MLSGIRAVKRVVQLFAGFALVAMIGFPVGAAWLDAHPESGLASEAAFANIDRKADVFTQAGQLFNGLSKTRELIADEKRERDQEKLSAEFERKEAEQRRFNSGQMARDDQYASTER